MKALFKAELSGEEEEQQQFLQYAEYAEPVRQMPSIVFWRLIAAKN